MSKVRFLAKRLVDGKDLGLGGAFLASVWLSLTMVSSLIWGWVPVGFYVLISPAVLLFALIGLIVVTGPITIPVLWVLHTLESYKETPKPGAIEPDPFQGRK